MVTHTRTHTRAREHGDACTPFLLAPLVRLLTPFFFALLLPVLCVRSSRFNTGAITSRGAAVLVKEPVCRGRDFLGVFRRLRAEGWSRDHVAVFDLAAYGPEQRRPPNGLPPVRSIGVGSNNYTFDIELLSEEDAKL